MTKSGVTSKCQTSILLLAIWLWPWVRGEGSSIVIVCLLTWEEEQQQQQQHHARSNSKEARAAARGGRPLCSEQVRSRKKRMGSSRRDTTSARC